MKKNIRAAGLIALLAFLTEVFLFNARAFELITCKSPSQEVTVAASEMAETSEGRHHNLSFTITGKENFPVDFRTVRIIFSKEPTASIAGTIYTSEKNFRWGHTREFEMIPGIEHSEVIFIYPEYRVQEMTVTVSDVSAQDIRLVFNAPVPMRFNFFRFLVILIVYLLLFLLRPKSSIWRTNFDLSKPIQKGVLAGFFVIHTAFLIFTALSSYPDVGKAISAGNKAGGIYRNKVHYELLTEAFLNGSVSLLEMPPSSLATLQNPYDTQERNKNVPNSLWDAVYYGGKYYCYFGPVPVLTLFLPWRLVTGKHLFSDFAGILYAILASIGFIYCVTWAIRRWFPTCPAPAYFMTIAIILNTSGLAWCVRRSLVYEIALLSACAFAVCGLALNMSSISSGNVRHGRLFFGCLLMALAVGCRPTAAFISLLNIPLAMIAFFPDGVYRNFFGTLWKNKRTILLCVVPYLIVAGLLMGYNFLRFGNPFEFGRTYQFSYIDANIYNNGLTIPSWFLGIANFVLGTGFQLTSNFPFIAPAESLTFDFAGYKEFNAVFSVGTLCPLIFLIPLVSLFLKKAITEKGKPFFVFFLTLWIVPLFLAGFSSASAGMLQRYMMDFYWMIILAGLFSALIVFEWLTRKNAEAVMQLVFVICFAASVFFSFALSCGEPFSDSGKTWFETTNPQLFENINFLLSFWK